MSSAETGDTIVFATDVSGTITLTSGEILITKSVAIHGPGADALTITTNRNSRAFYIRDASAVAISGLTISDCSALGGNGGGVHCLNANVSINECVLQGNSAFSGGAICNSSQSGASTVTIINSTISANTARSGGGGVANFAFSGDATVVILNSTVSGNVATSPYQNESPNGGGILNQSNSGNPAIRIMHSTFWGNHVATSRSSFYGDTIVNTNHAGGSPTVEIGHSIIDSDGRFTAIANLGGTITSRGYNICSDAANGDTTTTPGGSLNAMGDRRNTDPRLAPLANNGGATPTHSLYPESPAIDAGDPNFDGNALGRLVTNDQRGSGYSRLLRGDVDAETAIVDIGAVERFLTPILNVGAELATTLNDSSYDLAAKIEVHPAGGVFSGPGVSNGIFDAGQAGLGIHTLTYTVSDGSNTASISFEIVVHPTPRVIGIYNGLVSPAPDAMPTNEHAGLVRLSTNGFSGRFSGILILGGTRHPFSGLFERMGLARFGKTGTSSLVVKRKNLPDLELRLQVAGGQKESERLSGTLSEGESVIALISAERAAYSSKRISTGPTTQVPAELLGDYTVIFSPTMPEQRAVPPSDRPQGYGIGTLTFSKNGKARIAGSLADGTPIIYLNMLSKTNSWPFYVSFGGGTGSVSGIAVFRETINISDIDGLGFTWFKGGNSKSRAYSNGWPQGITINLLGSKFVSPPNAGESSLSGIGEVTAEGNAELRLRGGSVPSAERSVALNITPNGTVKPVQSGTETSPLNLQLGAIRTAVLKGTFVNPDTKQRERLRGVIFQKQQAGFGYFLEDGTSGAVEITTR